MILAAGRGERMSQLTRDTPKALLKAGDKYLIEYSIYSLKKMGIQDVIINVCHHKEKIKTALGNGQRYGITIHYSDETEALETGGGIVQALPLLGDDPFIVLSCDIVTDYPLQNLPKYPDKLAHLVLVDNPSFHPKGDFCLYENPHSQILHCPQDDKTRRFTFANIGVYRKELFAGCQLARFRLGDLLKQKIAAQQVTGEHYAGFWHNLGTSDQLVQLNEVLDNLQLSPV